MLCAFKARLLKAKEGDKLKKTAAFFLTLCLALTLSGCATPFGAGEELLASPQLSVEQRQITQALSRYLDEGIRLKYPRRGENLAPFIFCDMDGDGIEEAITFYTLESKGKNVQLALLTQKNGDWTVSFDMEGDNTDIDCIALAPILQNGTTQLVVGYTSVNLSDKALAVYSCTGETLQKQYEQPYDNFEADDLTGNGFADLAAVSAGGQPGLLQLTLLSGGENGLDMPKTTQLSTQFTSCISFIISENEAKEKILVVDGYTSGDTLTTEVLKYINGTFSRYTVIEDQAFHEVAARNQNILLSMDLDADGTVEVPSVEIQENGVPENGRFCWTYWYGFTQKKAYGKCFALVDVRLGCALLLPQSWRGAVRLEETARAGRWRIVRIEDGKTLLYLQELSQEETLSESESKRYRQICAIGDYSIYIRLTQNIEENEELEYFKGIRLPT